MNPSDSDLPMIDPALLDLLVDGELSDPERRELLERLDCVPGGWRSCALAFLDAQCWRESLSPLPREQAPPVAARAPSSRPRRAVGLGTLLAMAASFLLALGLGLAVRSAWFAGAQSGGSLAGGPAEAESPRLPPQGESPLPSAPQLAKEDRRGPPAAPEAPAGKSWETVRVNLPGRLGEGQIDLPVTPAERLDESWLRPAPLPDDLREGLRRMGYEIRQHRELVPAPLDDGRRVVMPVDQVEIRYVGNGAYQ